MDYDPINFCSFFFAPNKEKNKFVQPKAVLGHGWLCFRQLETIQTAWIKEI